MAGTRSMGASLTLKKKGSESANIVFKSLASIGAISGSTDEIDVTTLDSPNRAKEYISGAADYGSVEVEQNVTSANTDQVEKINALFASGDLREWERTDDTGTVAFTGYVAEAGYGEETVDGLVKFNYTIRISGKPTFTPSVESE